MRSSSSHLRFQFFVRAIRLAPVAMLSIVMSAGCGSVNSAGGDAAAGTSGQGGHAGDGAGGATGSAGSTGAAGSGTAGTTGTAGSSVGNGGSNGGAAGAGRGGGGGTAGSSGGGSTGSGGGAGTGSGGRGGSTGSAGTGGTTGSGGRGGAGGPAGAGGSAGSTGGGGAGGAGGSAGSTGGGGAGGTTSPCQAVLALGRSCTTAADCFAGAHTSNCCGQVQFIGFRNSVKTQFQTLEAQCDATYPACGCAAGQPTADDGSRLRFGDQANQAGVTCSQGKCTTFVPDCGQPCGAGTTCFSCSNRNQIFAACTTMCTDSNSCLDPTLPRCQMGSSGNVSGMYCTTANVACDTK